MLQWTRMGSSYGDYGGMWISTKLVLLLLPWLSHVHGDSVSQHTFAC